MQVSQQHLSMGERMRSEDDLKFEQSQYRNLIPLEVYSHWPLGDQIKCRCSIFKFRENGAGLRIPVPTPIDEYKLVKSDLSMDEGFHLCVPVHSLWQMQHLTDAVLTFGKLHHVSYSCHPNITNGM